MKIQSKAYFSTKLAAGTLQSTLAGSTVFGQLSVNVSIRSPETPLEALDMLEQWRTLDEHAQKKTTRWRAEAMPLQVYIHPDPSNPALANHLFQILRQWEVASLGLIRFQQIFQPLDEVNQSAGIQIVWSDATVTGRDFEVGHTHREVCGDWIQTATITLIRQPVIDRFLSKNNQTARLYTTILHEMGHALGLEHSDSKADIMHHRGWQNRSLSLNDAQRIQDLYQPALKHTNF